MARRAWARSILVAFLASAGTATGQLGLGYGLGIIAWTTPAGVDLTLPRDAWPAALVWATWTAATAVVVGAICGDRRSVETGRVLRIIWRVVVALAATVGALVTVPLVAIPARHATIADNYAPHLLASVHATTGLAIGLIVAFFAMAIRAGATNVIASAIWAWVLAGAVAVNSLITGGSTGYSDLAVWEFTQSGPYWGGYHVPATLLMLGAALIIGAVAAFPAAARRHNRLGIALSGATGPVLVTAAYLLARPQQSTPLTGTSTVELAPYLVLAGLAGSTLVAVVGTVTTRRRRTAGSSPTPDAPGSESTAGTTSTPSAAAAPVTMPTQATAPPPAVAPAAQAPVAQAPVAQASVAPAAVAPLPPASPRAVSATASVPASSRVNPTDHPLA